jgi:hypothetical protein
MPADSNSQVDAASHTRITVETHVFRKARLPAQGLRKIIVKGAGTTAVSPPDR